MADEYDWEKAWNKPERTTPAEIIPLPANVNGASAYGKKALAEELYILANTTVNSHRRNTQLNESAFNLAQLVAAGHLDRVTTQQQLRATAITIGLPPSEVDGTLRSAFNAGLQQPRNVPELQIEPNVVEVTADDLSAQKRFWEARPVLTHIQKFAYARLASPWAVLGVTLVRTLHHIPPWVTLPPLIGGHGNLNLFIGLVGPSGGGKGAAEAAARDAITYLGKDPIIIIPAGSGEGLTHAYAHYENKTEGVIRDRNNVIFTSPEVDALAALGNRQGSTLMAQLRQAFSGETLGFAYADKTRKIIIEAHSYRFGYIVGVQPERAAALLDQTDGGTPQRFIWLPATDPTIGTIKCEEPPPKTVNWPHPKSGDITMPELVKQEIRDAHINRVQGNGESLDGHAVYAREKAAYALALLDGRLEMNQEDWELAHTIMNKSDHTRARVQATLAQKQQAANAAKAMSDGHREVIRGDLVDKHQLEEAARAITRKLSRHKGDWVVGKAVRDMLGKRREHFHDALDLLLEAGQIEVEHTDNRGRRGVRIRLSKEAR